MKKIIVAFVAMAIVAVANAATCAWSGSAVALQATGDSATSYTLYLLDASVTSAADMAVALSAGDKSLISAATVETSNGIAVGTTAARWNKSGFGSYATGDVYTYYTVIFNASIADASHYMITAEKTSTTPSSGALSMAFGTQAANTWVEIAPEPTSGLMMLLGMGVLALRRRRA